VGLGRRDLTIVQDKMSAKIPNMIGGVVLRERPFAQAKKKRSLKVTIRGIFAMSHQFTENHEHMEMF
jgi:transcription initiation factor TFIID subunit TAF12